MTPQILAPDYGAHNAMLDQAIKRLDYALAEDGALVSMSAEQTAVAFSTLNSVISHSTSSVLFMQHKPRRDAPSDS